MRNQNQSRVDVETASRVCKSTARKEGLLKLSVGRTCWLVAAFIGLATALTGCDEGGREARTGLSVPVAGQSHPSTHDPRIDFLMQEKLEAVRYFDMAHEAGMAASARGELLVQAYWLDEMNKASATIDRINAELARLQRL